MRERYASKSESIIIPSSRRKERRCLRCNKKVVGSWVCPHCMKQNSTVSDLFDRYEVHGLSLLEASPYPEL